MENDDFEVQGVDPACGFDVHERVVHKEYGEGSLVCTIPSGVAVVHFFELDAARNVFWKELSKAILC